MATTNKEPRAKDRYIMAVLHSIVMAPVILLFVVGTVAIGLARVAYSKDKT
jgi:hypothetical protein